MRKTRRLRKQRGGNYYPVGGFRNYGEVQDGDGDDAGYVKIQGLFNGSPIPTYSTYKKSNPGHGPSNYLSAVTNNYTTPVQDSYIFHLVQSQNESDKFQWAQMIGIYHGLYDIQQQKAAARNADTAAAAQAKIAEYNTRLAEYNRTFIPTPYDPMARRANAA